MNFNTAIAFIDPPSVLSYNVTPVPGSASLPLQVVADTGARSCGSIAYIETSGDFLGVYTGPIGLETLLCIIGNGLAHTVNTAIAPHSRVSLRSMTATPITNGWLTITFMSGVH
jgi:hypothetical protein